MVWRLRYAISILCDPSTPLILIATGQTSGICVCRLCRSLLASSNVEQRLHPSMASKMTCQSCWPSSVDCSTLWLVSALLILIRRITDPFRAVLAGVITPPQIFASSLALPPDEANQLIAVSLIASGLLSCLQMSRIPLPFTRGRYYFGTGLITTVGTSFATLSTASAIFNTMYADGTCPSSVVSGAVVRQACPQAYGALLGTSCLCSLVGMALSFLPPKTLKRIFPPIVTGVVVLSIGASLIGSSSFPAWAGGSGGCRSRPTTGPLQLCPSNSCVSSRIRVREEFRDPQLAPQFVAVYQGPTLTCLRSAALQSHFLGVTRASSGWDSCRGSPSFCSNTSARQSCAALHSSSDSRLAASSPAPLATFPTPRFARHQPLPSSGSKHIRSRFMHLPSSR